VLSQVSGPSRLAFTSTTGVNPVADDDGRRPDRLVRLGAQCPADRSCRNGSAATDRTNCDPDRHRVPAGVVPRARRGWADRRAYLCIIMLPDGSPCPVLLPHSLRTGPSRSSQARSAASVTQSVSGSAANVPAKTLLPSPWLPILCRSACAQLVRRSRQGALALVAPISVAASWLIATAIAMTMSCLDFTCQYSVGA
jgi:hypothetical protein